MSKDKAEKANVKRDVLITVGACSFVLFYPIVESITCLRYGREMLCGASPIWLHDKIGVFGAVVFTIFILIITNKFCDEN